MLLSLNKNNRTHLLAPFMLLVIVASLGCTKIIAQQATSTLKYSVSLADPANHQLQVSLYCKGWRSDSIQLKMPKWMPGYYQLMDYAKAVSNIAASDDKGNSIPIKSINENTWQVITVKNKPFTLTYKVKADKQFVANSYVDSAHAYLVTVGLFLYIDGHINTPVAVKINMPMQWKNIATGLTPLPHTSNEFTAPDFDILYDCPILAGNLEALPSFKVKGINHRFIGYKMGSFDKEKFIRYLTKIVTAASDIIGDIPYKEYTFIGIGPGRGGIEHLNNTTVSFTGQGLDTEDGMNRMMNFLAHEYFHHYNVKRIRPLELGPFDYDKGSRTNLLWVSEGLSVYYEYMAVKRAGLADGKTLLKDFEDNINAYENDPGRFHQSLVQASYHTWSDGPFGKQGGADDKSISYYDKGPVAGMLLDFTIRNATNNSKSLDDVMRFLYWQYYKKLQRGFTDAEFQQACESVAGVSLNSVFEYVYTTKEIDYKTYLGYAGLNTAVETDTATGKRKFVIEKLPQPAPQQAAILRGWLGE